MPGSEQSGPQGGQTPQGGQIQQGDQQSGGLPQPSGMIQQFQQPNAPLQGGGQGGYCGDGACDSVEQETGGCPQDCR